MVQIVFVCHAITFIRVYMICFKIELPRNNGVTGGYIYMALLVYPENSLFASITVLTFLNMPCYTVDHLRCTWQLKSVYDLPAIIEY